MCAKIKGLLPSSLRLRIDQMYENIGVGSFSILGYWGGGGKPRTVNSNAGGYCQKYIYACVHMHMYDHTCVKYSYTHACMHTHVCMHAQPMQRTFYSDMKIIKIKASNLYEKNSITNTRKVLVILYCLKAYHLYTCTIKIKAMDLHL